MKLLFDQNISYRIIKKLPADFSECKQVSHIGLNDRDDLDIWQYARDNNYAIVTFDSDFYDISLINGFPPKIIWLRTGNLTTSDILQLLKTNFETIKRFLNNTEFSDIACLEIE